MTPFDVWLGMQCLTAWSRGEERSVPAVAGGLRLSAAGFAALFIPLLAEQRLAGEANLIALDRKHLHQHLIAQLEFIADVADTLLGNLADVKQPIRAGKELDKGPEFGQAHDLAEVSLADLGRGGDLADHL